ncbi:AAA family ATPase [Candidatus Woesearchaeota archaeon]|nr:AAA family ATPase [Candidatus Woesearchaeota archaeon]
MISTGIQDLDNLIRGYKGLTVIYGPASTGKTTLCLIATISELARGNKVIFLDTERGFSIERLKQINDDKKIIDNLLLFNAGSFKKQLEYVRNLNAIRKNASIGLIIIDSLGNHYRRLLAHDKELANGMLMSQIKTLKELSKSIPILVSNQVYADVNEHKNKMVGGYNIKEFIDNTIELKKFGEKRFMQIKNKLVEFGIHEKGISIL